MRRSIVFLLLVLSPFSLVAQESEFSNAAKTEFLTQAPHFLETHCVDCHRADDPASDVVLEDLESPTAENFEVWRRIWAQVTLHEMPPIDSSDLNAATRYQFTESLVDALVRALKDHGGFHDHLDPSKGNFLDHDLLFGDLPDGIELRPASTPARLWRVTPEEHLTRMNELINKEPVFDPQKPGLRARGDVVPTNHGGERKIYFGTDRITKWLGGTVAYATAVKSVPAVLSTARKHGLENYPHLYSVNSAESIQILALADDILRYMAHGPLSIANTEQITDDPSTYVMEGDIRGLPTSLVYSTKVTRPLTPVFELFQAPEMTNKQVREAVEFLFEKLTGRRASQAETDAYTQIVNQSIDKLGPEDGAVLGLAAIFLDRDALFRPELVLQGESDAYGRVMMQDWELGLAINHALCYITPDAELRRAILDGRMRTRSDVKREVSRMLEDDQIRKPRILKFFRDYFDYDLGGYVCKDNRALLNTGIMKRGDAHYRAMFDAVASTDRLVEWVLAKDTDVLAQLLTTDKAVVTQNDRIYFGTRRTPKEFQRLEAAAKAKHQKALQVAKQTLSDATSALSELQKWMDENPSRASQKISELQEKKTSLAAAEKRVAALKKDRPGRVNRMVKPAKLTGPSLFARVSRRSFGRGSLKPERILATVPNDQRIGILTHPSWLVSHSDAMDNHAIRRGRWIRERLLGGGIPDIPITVNAMLPDQPHQTLRQRMEVTRQEYCWTCHKKMDPLGLPFEMYNHAGLFRTTEKGQPVETSGEIIESGDSSLDGEVPDALALIKKLASSERAEQVFVRYAFRFWIGRNETIHDAPVLQSAHRAYRESGGSMKALIISLLTSDAFLYRTRENQSN